MDGTTKMINTLLTYFDFHFLFFHQTSPTFIAYLFVATKIEFAG